MWHSQDWLPIGATAANNLENMPYHFILFIENDFNETDINPLKTEFLLNARTSQETHYVSTTETDRLLMFG
jgi:hypothetical protein